MTLQALDANGFGFTHWSGDCTGTSRETTVTMDQARFCTADFRPFTLGVSIIGSGVVSRDGSFDQCAGTCTFTPREATATLRATPAEGWQFDAWTGDCAGTSAVTTVDMTADRACVARFVRRPGFFFLTVEVFGLGSVTSDPPGVACSVIVLNATAPLFQLTDTKTGGGQGTIASDPPGLIRCDEICTGPSALIFEAGSAVTLVATAAPGSQFAGWSGCDTVTADRCSLTLGTHRAVTATFTPVISNFTLTVNIITNAVTQNASVRAVSPTSNTINCFASVGGLVCSQSFAAGTVVAVRPGDLVLESPWLATWSGCDVVTALLTCQVTLSSDRVVTLTVLPR